MTTILCPHCDANHPVSDDKFLQAVGKVVKCRTCKQSFQVQPRGDEQVVELTSDPPVPVVPPVKPKTELLKAPDRTAAFHSILAMRSQPYVNIIASFLVLIAGFLNIIKEARDPHAEKPGYTFAIGIGMLIVSWVVNAHLRRLAATLEIQINTERLLVTIANNTARDDAQTASESASTSDGRAT